jgi:methylmalonyl-CoA mutase N-terminal domain/subunit
MGGLPLEPSYGPDVAAHRDIDRDVPQPGTYPYTRGIHESM